MEFGPIRAEQTGEFIRAAEAAATAKGAGFAESEFIVYIPLAAGNLLGPIAGRRGGRVGAAGRNTRPWK
jgi:hypothetical protein